jgi:glycosyltransferase involved in cell wall biosynthesis
MAAKQRIAFVANTSWSIYKFRLYLIEKLLKKGYTVFVLAPRDAYTSRFENLAGLTFIELHHLRAKTVSPFQDLRLYRELLHHYRTLRPHLIFHYTIKANLFGTLAASRTGIPAVAVITGLGYTFADKGWLYTAVRLLYKNILPRSTEVWVLNADDRDTLIRLRLAKPDNIFLLPGEGVDTNKFSLPSAVPQNHGTTFLFIGRLLRHKGIYQYMEAARMLRSQGLAVRCLVLGDFDDNPSSIHRSRVEQGHREGIIEYLGYQDEIMDAIERAHCIVLPSYYGEGLPMSLLEGASMARALIAADTPGCRSLIRDGMNGYLCRKKDATDLAKKMAEYFYLPPAAKERMGIESRSLVLRSFTADIVAGIYLDKIHKLTTT